ncbi:MAG: DUF637 domain-containing protein, partial [Alphaproteobacteria bacterium]
MSRFVFRFMFIPILLWSNLALGSVSEEFFKNPSFDPSGSHISIEIQKNRGANSLSLEIYNLDDCRRKTLLVSDLNILFEQEGKQRYVSQYQGFNLDFFLDDLGNVEIFSLETTRDVSFTVPGILRTNFVNSVANVFFQSRSYENLDSFMFGQFAKIITIQGEIFNGGLFKGRNLTLESPLEITLSRGLIKTFQSTLEAPSVTLAHKSEIISSKLSIKAEKTLKLDSSNIFSTSVSVDSLNFLMNQSYFYVKDPFSFKGKAYYAKNGSVLRGEKTVTLSIEHFRNLRSTLRSAESLFINFLGNQSFKNEGGEIYSEADLFILGPLAMFENRQGRIRSKGDLELEVRTLRNIEGSFIRGQEISVTAEKIYNTNSTIKAENALDLQANGISNESFSIFEGREVVIKVGKEEATPILVNKDSNVNVFGKTHAERLHKKKEQKDSKQDSAEDSKTEETSGGTQDKLLGSLMNLNGSFIRGTELVRIISNGEIINGDFSRIESPVGMVDLTVQGRILNHDRARITGKTQTHLTSEQGNIFNSDQAFIMGQDVALKAKGNINNVRGIITASVIATLSGSQLDNASGNIATIGSLDLRQISNIFNMDGKITSENILLTEGSIFLNNERGVIKSKSALKFLDFNTLQKAGVSLFGANSGGWIESQEKIMFLGKNMVPSYLKGTFFAPVLEFVNRPVTSSGVYVSSILGYRDPWITLNCDSLIFRDDKNLILNDSVIEGIPYELFLEIQHFSNNNVLKTKRKIQIDAIRITNEGDFTQVDPSRENFFPFSYIKNVKNNPYLTSLFRDLGFDFTNQEGVIKSMIEGPEIYLGATEHIINYGGLKSQGDIFLRSPYIRTGWGIEDEETEILEDGGVRRDKFDWTHHFFKPQPNCYINVGGQLHVDGVSGGKFLSTLGLVQVLKGMSMERVNLFLNFAGTLTIEDQPDDFEWRVPYFLNTLGIIDTSIVAHRYWQIDFANSDPSHFNILKGKLQLKDVLYALNAASFLHGHDGILIEGMPDAQKTEFLDTFSGPDGKVSALLPSKAVNQNYVETYVRTVTKTGTDVSVSTNRICGIKTGKTKTYTPWRLDYPEQASRGGVHVAAMSSAGKMEARGVDEAVLSGGIHAANITLEPKESLVAGDQRNIKMPEIKQLPDFVEVLPNLTEAHNQQIYEIAPEDALYVLKTKFLRDKSQKIPVVIIEGEEKIPDLESYKMLLHPDEISQAMIHILQKQLNTGYVPSMKTTFDATKSAYRSALAKEPDALQRRAFAHLPQENTLNEDPHSDLYYKNVLVIRPDQVEEGLYFVPRIIEGKKVLVPVLHLKKGTINPALGRPDGANIAQGDVQKGEGQYIIDTDGAVTLDGVNIGEHKFKVRARKGIASTTHFHEIHEQTKSTEGKANGGFWSNSTRMETRTEHHVTTESGYPAIFGSDPEGIVELDAEDSDITLTGATLVGGDINLHGWKVLLQTLDLEEKRVNEDGQDIIVPTYVQSLVLGSKKGFITVKIFENQGSKYITLGSSKIVAEYVIKQAYKAREYCHKKTCKVVEGMFSAGATEEAFYHHVMSTPELQSFSENLELVSQLIDLEGIVRAPSGDLVFEGGRLQTGAQVYKKRHTLNSFTDTAFGGAEQSSYTEIPEIPQTNLESQNIRFNTVTADINGTTIKTHKVTDSTKEGMRLASIVGEMKRFTRSSQSGAFGTQSTTTKSGQEGERPTVLDVDKWESIYQRPQFTNVEWSDLNTRITGLPPEEKIRVLSSWIETSSHSNGLGKEGALMVAIAVTVATGGAGASSIGAAMAYGAMGYAASQAAVSFLQTGGDLESTVKGLTTTDSIQNMIIAAGTAGVMQGISPSLNSSIKDLPVLTRNFISSTVQTGVQ